MTEESTPISDAERDMAGINKLLAELKPYESDRQNEQVTAARELLHKTFSQTHNRLMVMGNGLIPLYYGSLQYGDPINLDCDIKFVSQDQVRDSAFNILADGITEELDPQWPTGSGLMDLNKISLQSINQVVERVHQEGEPITDYDDDVLQAAAVILTGKLILPEQEPEFTHIRNNLLGLMQSSEILRRKIGQELQETLDIRKKRRSVTNQ